MSTHGDAYHWLRPDVEEGPTVRVPDEFVSVDLCRGSRLDPTPSTPLVVTLEKLNGPPPHWIGDRIPLVSPLFLSTLRRACVDNFQSLPALLRCHRAGDLSNEYVAFNVIGLLDGADREASVGTPLLDEDHGPKLVDYSELVLARSKTRGLGMFRLADCPAMLLVHNRVRRVLAASTPNEGWGFSAIEIELR